MSVSAGFSPVGYTRHEAANERYRFTASRKPGAEFLLVSFREFDPNDSTQRTVSEGAVHGVYDSQVHGFIPLPRLLGHKNFRPTRAQATEHDGRNAVAVDFTVQFEPGDPFARDAVGWRNGATGTLYFLSELDHALGGSNIQFGAFKGVSGREQYTHRYEGLRDGIPVLREAVYEKYTSAKGHFFDVRKSDFRYTWSDPDADAFTLSRCGLPEPVGLPANRPGSGVAYWLLAAAAACAVVAIALRRRRSPQPTGVPS